MRRKAPQGLKRLVDEKEKEATPACQLQSQAPSSNNECDWLQGMPNSRAKSPHPVTTYHHNPRILLSSLSSGIFLSSSPSTLCPPGSASGPPGTSAACPGQHPGNSMFVYMECIR